VATDFMKIDEEIEKLQQDLKILKDTHPAYIPSEIKKLQGIVIAAHSHLDSFMGTLMIVKLKKVLNLSDVQVWRNSLLIISPMLDNLAYMDKVNVLSEYGDVPKELLKALKKVNFYRIEFAHPDGEKPRNKYNYSDPNGKEKIRDLLRCLVDTRYKMDDYFIKIEALSV
jgi:hypothetical protein